MKSNKFLQVITGCVMLVAAGVCRAEDVTVEEARRFAAIKGEELLMSFQEPDLVERYRQLDALFMTYIDIDYVSRFVVGRYWRQMTAEQQKRYRDLFVRYGLAYYKTLPLDYAKKLTYEIKGAEKEGDFVNVATNVHVTLGTKNGKPEGQDVTLIFRLHKVGGIIKAVDVKVAESSLLLTYRGKFYEMIAQDDGEMEWFLEDLEILTSSIEHQLQENVSKQQNSLEIGAKKG